MIVPSQKSSVPLFHSLGNGTVEQSLNQRNNPWNINGTSSLKALADKVLERNKERNKPGTETLKSVPPMPPYSSACGTNSEAGFKVKADDLLYEFNERAAIAEYDGSQPPTQAQRIAYLDAFISILSKLVENDPHKDWLAQKIQIAVKSLETQGFSSR